MLHTAICTTQHHGCALPLIVAAGSPTATHSCSAITLGHTVPHPPIIVAWKPSTGEAGGLPPAPSASADMGPAHSTACLQQRGPLGGGQAARVRPSPPQISLLPSRPSRIGVPPAPLTQSLPIERCHLQALLLQVELPGGAAAPEPQALHGGTLGSGRLPAASCTGWSLKGGPTAGRDPGGAEPRCAGAGLGKESTEWAWS